MRLIAESGGKCDVGNRPIPPHETRTCPLEPNGAHELSDVYSKRGAKFLTQVNGMYAVNRGQFREGRRTAEILFELVTHRIEPALSTEAVSRARNPSAGSGELHQQGLEHNP